jgi:hypothetical protein
MRTVYSTSRLFVDKDVFDIIYLYLLETEENGYELVFNFQNQEKKKLISDEKVFDKKTRSKIVKSITFEDAKEVIFVDLLEDEINDFLNKLKGNY